MFTEQVNHYRDLIRQYPLGAHYGFVSQEVLDFCHSIEATHSREALANVHKLLLTSLIREFSARPLGLRLSPEVMELASHEHQRITREMTTNPNDFYLGFQDLFMKDLALCSGRLVPAGAQVLETHSRVPKRTSLRTVLFTALRAGGFYPWFQIHTSDKSLKEFTPDGWNRCYLRLAHLLELNPDIHGVFGSSWFYDPALREISPRLAYLRQTPEAHGAHFCFLSHDTASMELATSKSATRKALVEAGKYLPAKHLMLWRRQDLLAFAGRVTKA